MSSKLISIVLRNGIFEDGRYYEPGSIEVPEDFVRRHFTSGVIEKIEGDWQQERVASTPKNKKMPKGEEKNV